MNTNRPDSCPECGKPVPAESQHRLCPACLMAQAMASRTLDPENPGRSPAPPPTPEEIADKFPQFEILECLGRGGMGVVYKARQKSLNRLVAIKILAPESVDDPRFAGRFATEAELLAKLSHPHIVTIHDFGETGGLYYLVMEYVGGVNLRDLLREGKMPPEQALAIVPPVCEALQYAHEQGIVHRDIKPENILLDRDGRVKIADFGIAALAGDAGDRSGTPAYMAPEQQDMVRTVDHRADIYALGVVLYEMLTGERPTALPVPPSRRIQVDVRLDEVVLRALAQEPELRFQSAAEFRTRVETVAHQSGGAAVAPAPAGISWDHVREHGVDYRSRRRFLGLPLVHIASGYDPIKRRRRVARGWIAIGDTAVGGLAFGGIAFGGVAVGGLAGGVFGFGGVALALVAFGGLAAGLLAAVGGLAVGGVALGGMAFGYYAHGGGALGMHVYSATAADPEALRFFRPWAPRFLKSMGLWMATGMIIAFAINFFAFWWAATRQRAGAPPPTGPPAAAGDGRERFPFHRSLLHMLPVLILSIVWLSSGLEKGAVLVLGIVLTASTILQYLGPRKIRMKVLVPVLGILLLAGLAPLLFIKRDKFGPVKEINIPPPQAGLPCVLDFETGNLLTPPDEVVKVIQEKDSLLTPEAFRWMQQSGADVYARQGRLYFANCQIVDGNSKLREYPAFEEWRAEQVPGPYVGPSLSLGAALIEWETAHPWGRKVGVFCTGDGHRGVLDVPVRIPGPVSKAPEGSNVRYKLVHPAKSPAGDAFKIWPLRGDSYDGLEFRMTRTADVGKPFLVVLPESSSSAMGMCFLSAPIGDSSNVERVEFIVDEDGVKRLKMDLKLPPMPETELGEDLVMVWQGRAIADGPGRLRFDGKKGVAYNPAALDPKEFLKHIPSAGGQP